MLVILSTTTIITATVTTFNAVCQWDIYFGPECKMLLLTGLTGKNHTAMSAGDTELVSIMVMV
jgi:hypothetical protein